MKLRISGALAFAAFGVACVFGSAQSLGQAITTLVSFDNSHGANPVSGLIADPAGDLFGTTLNGGAHGEGTVFEITKTSAGYASTPTVLYSFCLQTQCTDGANPTSLIIDAAGNLFGTTYNGGNHIGGSGNLNFGTVFELKKHAGGNPPYIFTVLVSFYPQPSYVNQGEGAKPFGGLVLDADENLFGTTTEETYGDYGTVFEIPKTRTGYASTPTTWWNFSNYNGEFPYGSLIIYDGYLFGTTYEGTINGYGAVFSLSLNNGPSFAHVPFNERDGAYPYAGVITDATGNLFGTTYNGGETGRGTVFKIAKTSTGYASTPTVLHSFCLQTKCTDGWNPRGGLIIYAGDLYGTTVMGGASGYGTVFVLTNTGGFGYLSFNGTNIGAYPFGGVIAVDGDLFGTTYVGGAKGYGTVFEVR
jgi:uncharacterized repeat protein (TIGR03803 family)